MYIDWFRLQENNLNCQNLDKVQMKLMMLIHRVILCNKIYVSILFFFPKDNVSSKVVEVAQCCRSSPIFFLHVTNSYQEKFEAFEVYM